MAVETATNFTKDFICWATNMVTLLSSKCSSAFFNALNSLYLTPYFSMTENRHWNQRLLDETFNRRYKFKQYFRWQIRQTKSLNSITSITSKEGTSPTVLLHFSHVLTLFFYGNLVTRCLARPVMLAEHLMNSKILLSTTYLNYARLRPKQTSRGQNTADAKLSELKMQLPVWTYDW